MTRVFKLCHRRAPYRGEVLYGGYREDEDIFTSSYAHGDFEAKYAIGKTTLPPVEGTLLMAYPTLKAALQSGWISKYNDYAIFEAEATGVHPASEIGRADGDWHDWWEGLSRTFRNTLSTVGFVCPPVWCESITLLPEVSYGQ